MLLWWVLGCKYLYPLMKMLNRSAVEAAGFSTWLSALLCDAARSTRDWVGATISLKLQLNNYEGVQWNTKELSKHKAKHTVHWNAYIPLPSGCDCPSCGVVGSPWAAGKGERGHVIQEQSMLWSNSWGAWLMWTGPATTHQVWGWQLSLIDVDWIDNCHYCNVHR